MSNHLTSVGLARLSLISCFRHICNLGDGVLQIGWVFCRSIKAITPQSAEQAYELTKNLSDERQQSARSTIGTQLASTEFRIVTNVAPHWRANIVYAPESSYTQGEIAKAVAGVEKYNSNPTKRMVNAGLPLVCVADTLPRRRRPRKLKEPNGRQPRSDSKKMQRVIPEMNLYCFDKRDSRD